MNVQIAVLTPQVSVGAEENFHTHVYFIRPTYDSAPGTGIGTKTITANGTYHAGTDGLQGYGEVTVNVSGGGGSTLIEKTVSANGVYNASSDSADGYSKVTVSVPASAVDTGTKSISTNGTHDVVGYASANVSVPASAVDSGTKSITSNGTHDVVGYASASVSVPNSYAAADEGKVVSNGALVAQTSDTVTANDTYDTTLINSLTVNVSGGASYEGIEVKYDSNDKVTDYVFHMEKIPKYALNYVQSTRQPSDGVAKISFATKPTHIGDGAFQSVKCIFDWSNLDELMYIGTNAFSSFRSDGYDGSSEVVNMPKFVGYYDNTYSALNVFRANANNNAYTPKIYNLPVCTSIPQYAWYQCSGTGWDVTIGSIGHAVTESRQQPFGGNTGITGTCTIYTTGDKVDTLNTAVQNGAGAGLVFVFKASEATTYNGNSYAAGATMLTA